MPRKITKPVRKEKVKKEGVIVDVLNTAGKVVGKEHLPQDLFAAAQNPALVAQAVRVYRANSRAGTHDTKTRSEVSRSTRKIYRQKGTGRARHGSLKAPIFIGGGIAHGPHPRNYRLALSKKMRRAALGSVLTSKLKEGSIKVISQLGEIPAKTKSMVETLSHLTLLDKNEKKQRNLLLLTVATPQNVILAGRNLPYLTITSARMVNAYMALSHDIIVIMKEAVNSFVEPSEEKAEEAVAKTPKVTKAVVKKEIKPKKAAKKPAVKKKPVKKAKK